MKARCGQVAFLEELLEQKGREAKDAQAEAEKFESQIRNMQQQHDATVSMLMR
jgi:hypothetical protein